MSDSPGQKKKILCPIERAGKTHWKPMGIGFVNKDLSINVHLEGFPVNGKLQIRDWDDDETAVKPGGRAAPRPAPGSQDEMPF